MADDSFTPAFSRAGGSRMAAFAVCGALLLSACSPAAQQSTGTRPVTQMDDELASLMRVAGMTRQSGEYGTAIALYRRAHEMSPNNPLPLVELARMLGDIGKHAEAALVWQDALQVAANDPAVQAGYGLTLARLGQADLAQPYLRKSVAAAPTSSAYNTLGVVLDQIGDAAGAQAAYRAGLKLAPNDISLANNLGLSLALSGQLDESLKTLERVVVRPDATARHRQNLALAYGLAGQDELSAQFGGIDSDPAEAQRNVMRYASIAALPDHATRVSAVGAMRGAQAGTQKSAASVQSAALVNSRSNLPKPTKRASTATKVEMPLTPMVSTTPMLAAKQVATKTRPAHADPVPLSMPARPTAKVVPKAKPPVPAYPVTAPASPIVTASGEKSAVKTPIETASAGQAAVTQASVNQVGTMDVNAAQPVEAGFNKASGPHIYRAEFIPKTEPDTAAVAAPVKKAEQPVAPATLKELVAEAVETVPHSTETQAVIAAVDKTPVQLADASVKQPTPDAVAAASGDEAASSPAPQELQAVSKSAAAEPAATVPMDTEGTLIPDPAPAYGPALAGIEVPLIDDRLTVAASAYHAEAYEFAATIWQPLADAGVERALFHLGALYYEGKGVERDLRRAYMLLRKAELAGFNDARIVLALVEAKLSDAERKTAESQLAAAAQ